MWAKPTNNMHRASAGATSNLILQTVIQWNLNCELVVDEPSQNVDVQ